MPENKITKNARNIFAVTTIAVWSYILINQLGLDNIAVYNAWNGYSLTEILNIISNPMGYQNDIVAQEMISAFTTSKYYSLLGLHKSAGIAESLTIQKTMTCLEVIAISIAGYMLPSIRKRNYSIAEALIGMILLSLGCTMDYGWGRWGWGFTGQTYIFPYAIWIFTLALARKGKITIAGLLQLAGTAIHPVIGLLSAISATFIILPNRRKDENQAKRIAIDAALKDMCKILGPTMLYLAIIAITKDTTIEAKIDNIDFINWTKSTNYHWYPWTEGLFKDSYSIIFPYTTIIYGAIVLDALRRREQEARNGMVKIYPALILISITSLAGVIASELLYNQVLVKLAIFRISKLGLIAAMPIYIEAFTLLFENNRLGKRAKTRKRKTKPSEKYLAGLAGTIYIISSLYNIYLWPYLAIVVIMLACILGREVLKQIRNGKDLNRLSSIYVVIGIALTMTVVAGIIGQESLVSSATNGKNLIIISGVIVTTMAIKLTGPHNRSRKGAILSSTLILLYIASSINIFKNKKINQYNTISLDKRVEPYYDIQVCANAKTPKNSIIMPPLDRAYGWRSTSERQSTGTARDWAITWVYTSNKDFFEEGRNRLNRIGLKSWLKFKHDDKEFRGIDKFDNDLKEVLKNTDMDELIALGKELGASHVVIEKLNAKKSVSKSPKNNMVECQNEYYQLVRTNNENKAITQ